MGRIERELTKARGQRGERGRGGAEVSELAVASAKGALDIASLPRVRLHPEALKANRIVTDDRMPASAAYKMLRTRVLQRMRRNGWTTLAVTGTCPGEGKTLTAINLAMSLARDVNTSTVLVDLDLRKPAIYRYLGISPQHSITDCLEGTSPLEKAVVNPGIDRLGLLLNRQSYTDSSELLSSPQMSALVEKLREGEGRIVIFDLPPMLATDDMLAFCPLIDSILLVLSQGTTKQDDLLAAKELLQEINVVGVILNRSSEDAAPYYYYYGT